MHNKYSRSLLSEQIHKYLIQEVKYQKQPHFIISFMLSNGDRMFIDIWTRNCYAQAFYKTNMGFQSDLCIKEGYIRYTSQIILFINHVDEFIAQVCKTHEENKMPKVPLTLFDTHTFIDNYDWGEN